MNKKDRYPKISFFIPLLLITSLVSLGQKDTTKIPTPTPADGNKFPQISVTPKIRGAAPITIVKVIPAIFQPGTNVTAFVHLENHTFANLSGYVLVNVEGTNVISDTLNVSDLPNNQFLDLKAKLASPPLCYGYPMVATFYKTDSLGLVTLKDVTATTTSITEEKIQATILSVDEKFIGFMTDEIDNDSDGVDDRIEQILLEKFRPYYKFGYDGGPETYLPIAVELYVKNCTVGGDYDDKYGKTSSCVGIPDFNQSLLTFLPDSLLSLNAPFGPSTLVTNPNKTMYHLQPNSIAKHGGPWAFVLSAGNAGLYGHVVPVVLSKPSDYHRGQVFCCCFTSNKLYFKIEYWQFFGYNYAHHHDGQDYADHQGDWSTVQLLVEAGTECIISVFHYAHGIEMRFDINPGMKLDTVQDDNGTVVEQYSGVNSRFFQPTTDIGKSPGNSIKDNTWVRFFQGTHPVVYLENGSHEFWPTESGRVGKSEGGIMYYSPLHSGDDFAHMFLTTTPPNLGEVEHPLSETPDANIILHYNGIYGCFNVSNMPPPGPPVHTEWTYPYSSQVYPALVQQLEN